MRTINNYNSDIWDDHSLERILVAGSFCVKDFLGVGRNIVSMANHCNFRPQLRAALHI